MNICKNIISLSKMWGFLKHFHSTEMYLFTSLEEVINLCCFYKLISR